MAAKPSGNRGRKSVFTFKEKKERFEENKKERQEKLELALHEQGLNPEFKSLQKSVEASKKPAKFASFINDASSTKSDQTASVSEVCIHGGQIWDERG